MERRTTSVQKHNHFNPGFNCANADWIFPAGKRCTSRGIAGSVVFRIRHITDMGGLPEDGAEGKEESRC